MGPGMRQVAVAWWLGKKLNAFPQKDDCTRATATSFGIEGTVPGMAGSAAWWLLAQADATSTRKRTRSVPLKAFIGSEDTPLHAETVTSGRGTLAWASVPECSLTLSRNDSDKRRGQAEGHSSIRAESAR